MPAKVVDASALASVLFGEPAGGQVAKALGNGPLFAPTLLRYEVGDVSALRKERCPCGRGLPLLDPVTTKAEDIVVTPDGRLVSSSTLTHPFKPLHQVARSQIIQEAPDHIRIRIVARAGYGEEHTRHLIEAMRRRLGAAVRIDVEIVDDIPVGATGKYRWVVSRVPLRFGTDADRNLFDSGAKEQAVP